MNKKILFKHYTFHKKTKKFVKKTYIEDDIVQSANFPEYGTKSSRLNTFTDWPIEYFLKSEDLAECGFFYTGKSDNVTCFSCGGGLNTWQPSDDINLVHALFFPNCKYLNYQKGCEYVQTHQKKIRENHDSYKCNICLDKLKNILFLPCAHVTSCQSCARQMVNCPICRCLILEEKEVFLT